MKDLQKFATVLVIDDNETIRGTLRMLLELEDFVVASCQDGKSGLDLAKKNHFDVILVDYQMPALKGDQTTRLLRALCPDAFIIGMSSEEKGQTFHQAGANTFIDKKHIVQKLVDEIRNHFSGQACMCGCGKPGEAVGN